MGQKQVVLVHLKRNQSSLHDHVLFPSRDGIPPPTCVNCPQPAPRCEVSSNHDSPTSTSKTVLTVTLDGEQRSGLPFRPDSTPLGELLPLLRALSELERGWTSPAESPRQPTVVLTAVEEGSLKLKVGIAAAASVLSASLQDALESGAQTRWEGVAKCVSALTDLAGSHPKARILIRSDPAGAESREVEVQKPQFIPNYDFTGPAVIVGTVVAMRAYQGHMSSGGSFEVRTEAWGVVRVHAPSDVLSNVRLRSDITLKGEGVWDGQTGRLTKLNVTGDQLEEAVAGPVNHSMATVLDELHASDRSHWDDVDVDGWIQSIRE